MSCHLPEMTRKTLSTIRSNGNGSRNGKESAHHMNNNSNSSNNNNNNHDGSYNDNESFQHLCFNANDFQLLAKKQLPRDLYEYLASGSDDEASLAENRRSFGRWWLRPRVLKPVGKVSTQTVLRFGNNSDSDNGNQNGDSLSSSSSSASFSVAMPVFVSPAGVHALCDPQHGECATARACANSGILFGLSQHSTKSIEQVAAATSAPSSANNNNNNNNNSSSSNNTLPSSWLPSLSSLKFYQSYILKDKDRTIRLIRRAIRAGYQGVFLTVDSVRFGYREADARNGFNALPPPHRLVNYDDNDNDNNNGGGGGDDGGTATAQNHHHHHHHSLDETYNSQEKMAWDQNSEQMFEQDVTWDHVRWIKRELAKLAEAEARNGSATTQQQQQQQQQQQLRYFPLVVKGILTAEDALLAVDAGADAIMLSNHGGRQLDGCPSALDVLPEVAEALRGESKGKNVPIWIDGGIRRGTDILKALALGASAVGIGKPIFFALSVGGQSAVEHLLHLLQTELEAAMAICGIERISDVVRGHVMPTTATAAAVSGLAEEPSRGPVSDAAIV
eukprot:CAMPEP_0172386416 /NCGR_PEP_ID=MMETSP1061-20121228/3978_1 /TAXON_ID=37318 /ORGANISM="Pseudo-nitzschia pungens, Strain cf. pungens" /LENGTH=559 /DNA_ID=CAMNT_0013115797 /DNA_START=216 /DNA_END=1896 /DNA_ORIENTATION=-